MKKMLKSENGITGIDITVSVLIITLFVAMLTTIFFNINTDSKAMERKTEATHYAISLIEDIKNKSFEELNNFIDTQGSSILDENGKQTPYTKKIFVIDYAEMEGNKDKKPNIVKKVTVEVSYMNKGETEKIELSTLLTAK